MIESTMHLAAVVAQGEARLNEVNILDPIFYIPRQSAPENQNYK